MQQLAITQPTTEAFAPTGVGTPEASPSSTPLDRARAPLPGPNARWLQDELIRWSKRLGLYFGAVLAASAAGIYFLWQIPLLNDLPQFLNNLSDSVVYRPVPPSARSPVSANNELASPVAPVAPGSPQTSSGTAMISAQAPPANQTSVQTPLQLPAQNEETEASTQPQNPLPAQASAALSAQPPAPAAVPARTQAQAPPATAPAQVATTASAPAQVPATASPQTPEQIPVALAPALAETANPPAETPTGAITVNRALPPGEIGAPAATDPATPPPPGSTAALAVNPTDPDAQPVAPVPAPTAQQEIQQLLEAARAQMENRRLTSPSSGNALSSYQRVLELEPNNPTAAEGIQRIATYYQEIARQSLQQGRTDEGLAYINRGLRAAPKSEVLLALRRQVRVAKQREDERRQALLAERQRLEAEQQALQQSVARQRFQDIPPQFQDRPPQYPGASPRFQDRPPQSWRTRPPPPQQPQRSSETGFNQR